MMNPNVKATANYIPGTTAWTMAVFEAADVPEGTQVQPVQQPAPVYWSLTYQGEHTANVFRDRSKAQDTMDRLNKAYPGEEDAREIVPLYAAPVAAPVAMPAASVQPVTVPELFCEKLAREMKEGSAVFVSASSAPEVASVPDAGEATGETAWRPLASAGEA